MPLRRDVSVSTAVVHNVLKGCTIFVESLTFGTLQPGQVS